LRAAEKRFPNELVPSEPVQEKNSTNGQLNAYGPNPASTLVLLI